jgi:anti-sigma B factor antagonist
MELAVEHRGASVAVVRCTGRLDLVSASRLRSAVEELVEEGRTRVVVDLEGIGFIDSSGLGMLVAGLKRTRQAGGELRLAAAGEQVRTVLTLTRLERVLRPYDTLDDALKGL